VKERMHNSPNGREDDEDEDEDDACDPRTGNCTPSYANSCVQEGLPREELTAEIIVEKTWTGSKGCSDGVWVHDTRGRGGAKKDDEKDVDVDYIPRNGHTGHFGVFAGNWGGKWKREEEDRYMNLDILRGPGQVWMLQEVEALFMQKVQQLLQEGKGLDSKLAKMTMLLIVRGDEIGNTLMVAARKGIVLGLRKLLFHRTRDGYYREKKKNKVAVSRILIVALKMANFRIRGSGDKVSDVLNVANVHMHSRTAKKDTKSPHEVTKRFWDLLASYLLRFEVRIMAGDFNMSLFCVIPELRARGFQINLAAWYPFHMKRQGDMFVDSCGVFVIGPWQGVRLIYDCSLFDIDAPERTNNNSMVMEQIQDNDGQVVARERYKVHEYSIASQEQVQGYPISSYMPKNKAKDNFVRWAFDCVQDRDESAVAEQMQAMKSDPKLYPDAQFSVAEDSWNWPPMPPANSKIS
jgi:hypothetical protein